MFFVFSCSDSADEDENLNDFTKDSGSFIDERDNHEYKWIKIGNQIWMAENLKATKYNDGTDIPNVTDNESWANLTTGAYCWYNNDAATNGNTYGALYNWYSVNSGKLAPKGWHVPSRDEWQILQNSLIVNGYNYDGTSIGNKVAKSLAAKTNWTISKVIGTPGMDLPSNNKAGFSGLPGGGRELGGVFYWTIGESAHWWTNTMYTYLDRPLNTMAYFYTIEDDNVDLIEEYILMHVGISVRCVKD